MNVMLRQHQNASTLAEFLPRFCGAPAKSTFLRVIENNNFFMARFNSKLNKYLALSRATAKGHLRREFHGL